MTENITNECPSKIYPTVQIIVRYLNISHDQLFFSAKTALTSPTLSIFFGVARRRIFRWPNFPAPGDEPSKRKGK